jgi:hypothetical protein
VVKSRIFEAINITCLLSNLFVSDSVSLGSLDGGDLIQSSHIVIE